MTKQDNFDDYNKYPRVLVVSHNSFSKSGSNGRTLGNFFYSWPKNALAQFYINSELPNFEVCDNYFRVTDIEALKAIYKGVKVGKTIKKEEYIEDNQDLLLNNLYRKSRKRTPFYYIARNAIWDSNRWKNKKFQKWVNDFNPDVVLLQLGDYAFMLRIALGLAKKRNIPLVVYNSEDYYFKDRKSLSPLYRFYRNDYKRLVRKLILYASHSIYNSEMLQETYQKEFKHKSSVIMTSTDVKPLKNKETNNPLKISYLGNFGVGRHESLIEISKELNKLDSSIYLDIYGKSPNMEIEKIMKSCSSINLKGFVSYKDVVSIMQSSDLLIHAENFNDFYKWDLKHAFSTKIADSLACKTCLFVFAPDNLAFVKYLQENDAACIVTDKNNLNESLKEIIRNKELRLSYGEKGHQVASKNHNLDNNAEKFRRIITSVV